MTSPPVRKFDALASEASVQLAWLVLAVLLASALLACDALLAWGGLAAVLGLWRRLWPFRSRRSRWPDLITVARGVITALLIAFCSGLTSPWLAAGVLAVLGLDGVDGYLARRLGAASQAGARLDMETDGYLVLAACWFHYRQGVGAWVLCAGVLRYVYVIVVTRWPGRGEQPRSRLARYGFALSLLALCAGLLLEAPFRSFSAGFANLVVSLSFARSFWWTYRIRS